MAGPCGCKGAGCGCCFIENPSSGVPYSVFGSGESGDCVSIDIENIVTTVVDNGDGTLTYTNEVGATVTWFDGAHYSVDMLGELAASETVPNVVAVALAPYGPANPLTVTIVNPSTVRQMSVHTTGTGEELLASGVRTATNSNSVAIECLYSVNGGAPQVPKFGSGNAWVPIRDGELRQFNTHTAPPIFVAVVPPSGSWFITLAQRRYTLSAALVSGSVLSQGQKILVSGSTTV